MIKSIILSLLLSAISPAAAAPLEGSGVRECEPNGKDHSGSCDHPINRQTWRSRESVSCEGWECWPTGEVFEPKGGTAEKRAAAPILPPPPAVELTEFEGIEPTVADLATTPNPCLASLPNSDRVWGKKEGPCDLIKVHPLPSYPFIDQIAMDYPRRLIVGNSMWGLIARDRITSQCTIVRTNEAVPCDGFDFAPGDHSAGPPTSTPPPPQQQQQQLPTTPTAAPTDGDTTTAARATPAARRTQPLAANGSQTPVAIVARIAPPNRLTPHFLVTDFGDSYCQLNQNIPEPCTAIFDRQAVEAPVAGPGKDEGRNLFGRRGL